MGKLLVFVHVIVSAFARLGVLEGDVLLAGRVLVAAHVALAGIVERDLACRVLARPH